MSLEFVDRAENAVALEFESFFQTIVFRIPVATYNYALFVQLFAQVLEEVK